MLSQPIFFCPLLRVCIGVSVTSILCNLKSKLVRLMMNSSLIEDIVRLLIYTLVRWYFDLKESRSRDVDVSGKKFLFINLTTSDQLAAELLDPVDKILAFARTKTADELQLRMHVLVVND